MSGSISLLPIGYLVTGWLVDVTGGVHTILLYGLGRLVLILTVLLIPCIRRYG